MSPTQPLMYATIPSQNSLAIIDTNTLTAQTYLVGSRPTNLAVSPDGSKVYIANSTTNFVVVFNTQTRTVVNSFMLPEQPQDVVFGSLNRLWVLGTSQIFQIDATTGASTGPSITDAFIYSGSLEISLDRNTLYYGDYGLSPATMYKFDVSGITPVLVRQTLFGTVGSNGEDLTLSHSGSYICYVTGSGQNNYDIAKFRTSDFASLGSFYTGPYPLAAAFSPDDSMVYASASTTSEIKVFNANTFQQVGTIPSPNADPGKLAVDSRGRYLFAGYTDTFSGFTGTRVYDTGVTNTMIWYLNNNVFSNSAPGAVTPTGWQVAGVADFNRDGHPDYLLFNSTTRGTVIWYMNNNVHVGSASGPTLPAGWLVAALADFNGDGYADYLLYNTTTRGTVIWYMRNNIRIGGTSGPTLPAGWQLVRAADFNRDGHPDYLLFNSATRATVIWYMNNNARIGGGAGPTLPAGWSVAQLGDFNRDGYPDYVLYNANTHATVLWYMRNNVRIGSASGPGLPVGWTLAGVADFDADGHPDYLLFNPSL